MTANNTIESLVAAKRIPYPECQSGWFPIILELYSCIESISPGHEVGQIKEKFGGLRYYIDGTPGGRREEVYELIDKFEHQSKFTCETCGLPGKLCATAGHWYKTLCKTCRADSEQDWIEA